MESIIQYIADLGFPIVISLFLLVRLETKMEALTVSINELSSVILENR